MNSLFDELKEVLQEAIDFEQKKSGNSLSKRVSAEIEQHETWLKLFHNKFFFLCNLSI